jgi:hypothetical protein
MHATYDSELEYWNKVRHHYEETGLLDKLSEALNIDK